MKSACCYKPPFTVFLLIEDPASAFQHIQFVLERIDENNTVALALLEHISDERLLPELFEGDNDASDHDALEINPDGHGNPDLP